MIKKKWGRMLIASSWSNLGGGVKLLNILLSKHLNEFIPSYLKKIADKNIFYNTVKIGLTILKYIKRFLIKT